MPPLRRHPPLQAGVAAFRGPAPTMLSKIRQNVTGDDAEVFKAALHACIPAGRT